MMGYGPSGFSMFGMLFMLVYLAAVLYFFVLLTQATRSLKRIAVALEKRTSPGSDNS